MKFLKYFFMSLFLVSLLGCGNGGTTNQKPIVHAGKDASVEVNKSIILNGTASDSDGKIISYEWKKGSKVLAKTASFTYVPKVVGKDVLTFTATDNDGASASDNLIVMVIPKKRERAFITRWNIDNQVTIPTIGEGYNYSIDWGDGKKDKNVTGDITHTYEKAGEYTVKILGDFPQIYFLKKGSDSYKLVDIKQWGDIKWRSMKGAFAHCYRLRNKGTIDKPDLSIVKDMSQMFFEANFNQDISQWDVSGVTDMSHMFRGSILSFNDGMSEAIVGGNFNQDISQWNVSMVTNMSSMFKNSKFNQDISQWDVSKVSNMSFMFDGSNFNKDISQWDVSSVTDMNHIFSGSTLYYNEGEEQVSIGGNFNQDISQWDVSKVTNMSFMYYSSNFNKDISQWDVSNVTNMNSMFKGNDYWYWDEDKGGYTSIPEITGGTFNQDISQWNVSKVTNMSSMFYYSKFNKDINQWDISSVTNMSRMFNNSDLSTINYDKLLNSWSQLPLHRDVPFGARGIHYSKEAESSRASMISNFKWDINDGGLAK